MPVLLALLPLEVHLVLLVLRLSSTERKKKERKGSSEKGREKLFLLGGQKGPAH